MGLDRKRKSINAVQSTDKKRKSIIEKKASSSSEDSDEQSDHDNGLLNEVKSDNPAISRWPQNDIQTLLSKMEAVLPKNDNITFRSRFSKLDWEKIKFDSYSKEECQSTWLAIQDQLRTFKTIGDLIHDAKHLLVTKGIDTYRSKTNRLPKPRTAYMLFYTEFLQKYKKKHPDLKLPQLTQIIADKYNKLTPDKKQTYLDRALKLKTEYIEMVDKTSVGFKSKEPNKPKTPFQIFMESKSSDLDSANVDRADIQNKLKEKWEGMTEKKKSKWIKLANEREQTYLNNLKEDHKNDPAFTMPTKSALTKGDRNILDSQSGKPKKPPVNNYGLFSKEMLQSDALAGVPPKERMSVLAKKWKAFSNEERQIYSDKLKVITDRYKTEFDAYLKTLPEDEKQIEMAKNKTKPKKPEPKVVPRINAREVISEKPTEKAKKKETSKTAYNSKTKMFKNEPKPLPYNNSFELYRSKLEANDKHPITNLEDWNKKKNERKQTIFENELKVLKKEYMKSLKVFLRSLSEEDLQLYLKLRKPEFLTENNDSVAPEPSENEGSSSSEEDDDDDNDNDEIDNDENDNDDNDDDSE